MIKGPRACLRQDGPHAYMRARASVVVLAHLFYAAPGALASVATAPGVLDQLGFQFFKIGVEVPKE